MNVAPLPPPQKANPTHKNGRDSELQWLVIYLILVFIIINSFILMCRQITHTIITISLNYEEACSVAYLLIF
jgi:hypothetical protein